MTQTPSKFHVSLNVANLERSLAFYRVLFGLEPAKCHADYAKFELAEPPVVFSLVPQPGLTGGSLSKIGLRLPDAEAVVAARQRVEAAGLPTQTPPGQTRCDEQGGTFYVADPDLNFWQVWSGEDNSCATFVPPAPAVAAPLPAGPVVWEHFVTQPLPDRLPHEAASVDEVRLTGTFNAALDERQVAFLLGEARRVLRPDGKVVVHGLVGDRPFPGTQPQLPGLAAMVARVPVQTELLEALQAAGFVGLQFVKFSEKPWFTIDGVELREVKVLARPPATAANGAARQVLYRGPCREAVDAAGNVYPRGQRVTVSEAVYAQLGESAAAGLAGLVQRVPALSEVLDALRQAGFTAFHYDTLGDITCLPVGGLELFEMRLAAWRAPADGVQRVLYQGPLARVVADDGTVLARGVPATVAAAVAQALAAGPAAGQFLFFPTEA